MKQAFDTEHLRVFESDEFAISEHLAAPRRLFVAFPPTGGGEVHTPLPVVTVLIGEYPCTQFGQSSRLVVDWIETASMYRRKGFAREVLQGLDQYLAPQPLIRFSGTIDGEKFLEKVDCEGAADRTGTVLCRPE